MSRFPRNVGGYERTEPAGEWVVACESVCGKLFPEPMARITEPIVRCRDCGYASEDGTECKLFTMQVVMRVGDYGVAIPVDILPADVEPDGFCKWGVPRGDDE